MIYKEVSTKDWLRLTAQAANVARASIHEDEERVKRTTRSLLRLLNRLEAKYGKNPSILATKSDYIKNVRRRIALLKSALSLARRSGNRKEKMLCVSSLCSIYIEDLRDKHGGKLWLHKFNKALRSFPDEDERSIFKELKSSFDALGVC